MEIFVRKRKNKECVLKRPSRVSVIYHRYALLSRVVVIYCSESLMPTYETYKHFLVGPEQKIFRILYPLSQKINSQKKISSKKRRFRVNQVVFKLLWLILYLCWLKRKKNQHILPSLGLLKMTIPFLNGTS